MGIDKIRIWVSVAKIFQRRTVNHSSRSCTQPFFNNRMSVRPGNCVHGIKTHPEAPRCQVLTNAIEIKQRLHQFAVILHGVDHLDYHFAQMELTQCIQIYIRCIDNFVLVDNFTAAINCFRHLFRCWPAIASIVFYAKITVWPAWIMAGR